MKSLLRAVALPIALGVLPVSAEAAQVIGTSPSSLSFGSVLFTSSSDLVLTIQNNGDANLSVTNVVISVGTDFSLVSPPSTPFIITPGGIRTVTVRFTPVAIGLRGGNLLIVSNDPVTPSKNVSLSGTGVAPVITLSPSSFDYGNVNVLAFSDRTVILGNNGNQILHWTAITVGGADSASFSVISGFTPPFSLSPGSTIAIGVRFAPTSTGTKNASLTFASDDPVNPNKILNMTGVGIGPFLTTPGALNYGPLHVGLSTTLNASLANGGGDVLTISSLSISGMDASSFSLISPPATPINLTKGQSVSVTVQFAPATIGAKAASLVVSSNDASSPTTNVVLAGTSIRPEPLIASVRDIPNDQGGKVKLSWDASTYDTQASPIVDHYWILRSVPPQAALARIERGARAHPLGDGSAGAGSELLSTVVASSTIYWELLTTVQALHFFEGYSYVAPTTSDSTPTSNPYTLFMVVALNAANTNHWDSAPDSGYSVDNLAPAAPAPLTGAYFNGATQLHWGRNHEADLAGYRVYRGASAGFVPGPSNRIGDPPDTGFADPGPAGRYYKLSAIDSHGNESLFAMLSPDGTLDVPGSGGVSFALAPPWPSPASREVDLVFALPTAGPASLSIFDAQGRIVRSLVRGERPAGRQSVHWDGRDDGGQAVGSGVYFARLARNGRTIDVRFAMTR